MLERRSGLVRRCELVVHVDVEVLAVLDDADAVRRSRQLVAGDDIARGREDLDGNAGCCRLDVGER